VAHVNLTAAQWAIRAEDTAIKGLVSNVEKEVPIFKDCLFRVLKRKNYLDYKRVNTAPTSTFRAHGDGVAQSYSVAANVKTYVKILESYPAVDSAEEEWAETLSDECQLQINAHSAKFESECLYGPSTEGFDGVDTLIADDGEANFFDGGEDTVGADHTNIFFLSWGPKKAQGLIGPNGLLKAGKLAKSLIAGATGPYEAYYKKVGMYPGLAVFIDKAMAQYGNLWATGSDHRPTLAMLDEIILYLAPGNKCAYMSDASLLWIKALLVTAGYDTGKGSNNAGVWDQSYNNCKLYNTPQVVNTSALKTAA